MIFKHGAGLGRPCQGCFAPTALTGPRPFPSGPPDVGRAQPFGKGGPKLYALHPVVPVLGPAWSLGLFRSFGG